MKNSLLLLLCALFMMTSCDEDVVTGPQLVFKFKFDPNQERLDGFGQPSTIPAGHGTQTPDFNGISANYIELAQGALTALGQGEVVYKGAETNDGGSTAIDFNQSIIVDEGEIFISIPLSSINPDTYKWLRISLSYQNYDILLDAEVNGQNFTDITATAASFIGYNNYIQRYTVKEDQVTVNGNRLQGFVGIETPYTLSEHQAPEGATTVPNPLFDTSPIPQGSCVVTGDFDQDLVITGAETKDIEIEMSLSINNSFEWEDDNDNDKYEPLLDEAVVDMGIRGLKPTVTYQ